MVHDPTTLLLIEDDAVFAQLLVEYLSPHGFAIDHVGTAPEGVARILETPPDLVLLDLMLPRASGLDVCREVRQVYSGAIVILTASQSDVDHVAGLELGADDFVVKPIDPRVLLARLRTQVRRLNGAKPTSPSHEAVLELGALRMDTVLGEAHVDGRAVGLTNMEFDILRLLARHAGRVVDRDVLYEAILGTPYDGLDRGMDVHVSRVRSKLQRAGFDRRRLKSVRGSGYLLAVP